MDMEKLKINSNKTMELLQQIEVQNAPHSLRAAQSLTTPIGSVIF
jgi:hypothetical protein